MQKTIGLLAAALALSASPGAALGGSCQHTAMLTAKACRQACDDNSKQFWTDFQDAVKDPEVLLSWWRFTEKACRDSCTDAHKDAIERCAGDRDPMTAAEP